MKTKIIFCFGLWLLLAYTGNSQSSWYWTNRANIPPTEHVNGARDFGVATLNGKLYTFGGLNFPSAISTVLEYDPVSDVWTNKANMLTPRYAPAAAALGGKIYAVGGAVDSSTTLTASMEEYDPVANAWTNKASMSQLRYAHQAVALNGKIYVLGGQTTGDVPLASVEEYDPVSNTWSTKADMPTPRVGFGAAVFDGKIYVIGGRMNNTPISPVYSFDPGFNTWATNASIPTTRETLAVVNVNDRIWAMGGTSTGAVVRATVEEYNPTSNTWASRPNLPTSRNDCFAVSIDTVPNTLFVFGGYNDNTMIALTLSPLLNIFTAIELEFTTRTNKTYYIQSSPDLTNWTNFDGPFVGDGNFLNKLYSTKGQSKLFYRVHEIP